MVKKTPVIPYLETPGPGYDLETFAYIRGHYQVLPPPKNTSIPFHLQGAPLPDPLQKHTQNPQIDQATHYTTTNPLPYGHFVGTFHKQINQPQFLSVNEILFD